MSYLSKFSGQQIDEAVEKSHLTGSVDPTNSTVGVLGQRYFNITTGSTFKCTAITTVDEVTSYTWENLAKKILNAKSANYTIVATDLNKDITGTGTITITLPAISGAGIGTGFRCRVSNVGTGTITVARTGTDTIAGSTSVSLSPGKSIEVIADATGKWNVLGFDFTDIINAHATEVVSRQYIITRDISLIGVQTVLITGNPKRIELRAAVNDAANLRFSIGSWEAGSNSQSCITMYKNTSGGTVSGHSTFYATYPGVNEANGSHGTIQNVTDGQFEINWGNAGSPTGTVTIEAVCYYH